MRATDAAADEVDDSDSEWWRQDAIITIMTAGLRLSTYVTSPARPRPLAAAAATATSRPTLSSWSYVTRDRHLNSKFSTVNCSQRFGKTITVTLTFQLDLLTSKSNQFTFVPNCIEVVKFLRAVHYRFNKL